MPDYLLKNTERKNIMFKPIPYSPAVYNILVTFITGGVSMVIFFFVFKIIFPEGEAKK